MKQKHRGATFGEAYYRRPARRAEMGEWDLKLRLFNYSMKRINKGLRRLMEGFKISLAPFINLFREHKSQKRQDYALAGPSDGE